MAQVPSNLTPTRISQLMQDPSPSAAGWMVYIRDGVTYKVQVGDLLQVSGVPTSRSVIAGTALQGGGQLSSDVTLSVAPGGIGTSELASTGVTPGVYGGASSVPQFTIDSKGRVTSATTVPLSVSGYVPTSRQVIAGSGLSGGGALSSDVTLSAEYSSTAPVARSGTGSAGVATSLSRGDHAHPAVDLSSDVQVDGLLGLGNGGTARSLTPEPGAIIWSGADGLYVGPAGGAGQVLVSGGPNAPTWGSTLIMADQPANVVYAGPAAGPDGPTTFRALVPEDVPILNQDTTGTAGRVANALTIGSGLSGVSYDGSGVVTIVNSAPDQTVVLTQGGTTAITGTYPNFTISSADQYVGDVVGPTGATDHAIARFNLATGKLIQNSVVTISDAGTSSGIEALQFQLAPVNIPTTPGSLYWDASEGNQTLSLVMAGGTATQQIGEETFLRIKASSAITDGQVVMFTGTVGASGALTGAPASGLMASTANYVIGIATQDIALNTWGYVTIFGGVRGVDTTGGAEAWVDGQILYSNPLVAGGLTKTLPPAPNAKVPVAVAVLAAVNGILFVRPSFGGELGQYEGDVQITAPVAYNLLQRNAANTRWENIAASSVTVGNVSGTVAIANGGTGATTAPNALTNLGAYPASNPSGYTTNTGTVTNVGGTGTVSGISLSGTVTTTGNLTLGGTLAVVPSNFASQTAKTFLAAPNAADGVPSFRAIVASDVPTLNQNTTGTAAAIAGGVASQLLYQTGAGVTGFISNGTAGQVLTSAGTGAPSWGSVSGGTF